MNVVCNLQLATHAGAVIARSKGGGEGGAADFLPKFFFVKQPFPAPSYTCRLFSAHLTMAGAKKSTKKFEKNHLKDVIERRKSHAKVKQRHQLNDKRKEKNATKRAEAEEANEIAPSKRRSRMLSPK